MDVQQHLRLRTELGVRAYNLARVPGETESSKTIFDRLWLFYAPRDRGTVHSAGISRWVPGADGALAT